MKASDQLDNTKSGFDIGRHSLFTNLGEAIARKIFSDAKIQLSLSGKDVASDGTITAVLTGFAVDDGKIGADVHQSISSIKNPKILVDLLG